MSRRIAIGSLLLLVISGLWLTRSADPAAEAIRSVLVTNFPETQRVVGEVSVRGAVRLSEFAALESVIVPPVRRGDTTRLVDGGTIVTDGFSSLVLSLHGQVKGSVTKRGVVGAILVPVNESILQAFNEQGLTHFGLEVVTPEIGAEAPYFASEQARHIVGFRSYRVLLYNTTDKTVTVELFAYLTS
jgi:hypothetical protein